MTDPQRLLAAAVAARAGSYSPYSRFAVGAALLDADGRVWTGANIENASYGLSMCAERTAVFHAVASGVKEFVACAVAGPPGVTTTPCGACRQVLSEFGPRMPVYYEDTNGALVTTSVDALLPGAFGPADLDEARR
ncbi:MAG: cytidine deaminase [Vulcanimicrobiaceae bacterium]